MHGKKIGDHWFTNCVILQKIKVQSEVLVAERKRMDLREILGRTT